MPAQRHVFTSESVTEGHPDKIADQISDAVLDAIIAKDPDARVACETLVTTGMAVIAGEDRKSTRLNSSHVAISYAVFCLKKKRRYCNNVMHRGCSLGLAHYPGPCGFA